MRGLTFLPRDAGASAGYTVRSAVTSLGGTQAQTPQGGTASGQQPDPAALNGLCKVTWGVLSPAPNAHPPSRGLRCEHQGAPLTCLKKTTFGSCDCRGTGTPPAGFKRVACLTSVSPKTGEGRPPPVGAGAPQADAPQPSPLSDRQTRGPPWVLAHVSGARGGQRSGLRQPPPLLISTRLCARGSCYSFFFPPSLDSISSSPASCSQRRNPT